MLVNLAPLFHAAFKGLERAHGTYDLPDKKSRVAGQKFTGKARTVQEPVTDHKWEEHLGGKKGIGIVPIDEDSACVFGAIDIDIYEGLDLKRLENLIDKFHLPLIPCTTKSGGIHLYLFTSEPVAAKIIRSKLKEFAKLLGQGDCEIFPKQDKIDDKATGNWINMPYFGGSRSTRQAVKNGTKLGPEEFLKHRDQMAVSLKMLKNFQPDIEDEIKGAPPCIRKIYYSTEAELAGLRDQSYFNLSVFFKKKYPDDWQDHSRAWCKEHLPKYCNERGNISKCFDGVSKGEYQYQCKLLEKICEKDECKLSEFGKENGGHLDIEVTDLIRRVTERGELVGYTLKVDGQILHIPDVESILLWLKFKMLCYRDLSIIPGNVKQPVWEDKLREITQDQKIDIIPDDATPGGQALEYVDQYFEQMDLSADKEMLLHGRPVMNGDSVLFKSTDLHEFLKAKRVTIGQRELWRLLESIGGYADKNAIKIKGKSMKVWRLPKDKVNVQTDDFTTPEVDTGGM